MKRILLALALLLQLAPAIAQRIDVEKKTGLISVDGTPSFYLTARNRILFTADYALENLQHQELAYLKAVQQPVYSPASGNTTETFYAMTFSQSGNSCELHGFTSFSVIKSLGRSIASARLIQNNQISREAERKFVMMYNGVFLQDPSDDPRGSRRGNDRYSGNQNDRNDRQYEDRRNGNDRRDDDRNNDDQATTATVPPLNINIVNGKIYDGDELIGTYKLLVSAPKGIAAYTIYDAQSKKVGVARHTNKTTDDWQITMAADSKKIMIRYREDSPLIKLFTSMAEKGYL
jgi:hypothetical protein